LGSHQTRRPNSSTSWCPRDNTVYPHFGDARPAGRVAGARIPLLRDRANVWPIFLLRAAHSWRVCDIVRRASNGVCPRRSAREVRLPRDSIEPVTTRCGSTPKGLRKSSFACPFGYPSSAPTTSNPWRPQNAGAWKVCVSRASCSQPCRRAPFSAAANSLLPANTPPPYILAHPERFDPAGPPSSSSRRPRRARRCRRSRH
jgi:hypothetical protein